jgi:peptidyl-dipeptidase Dcp
MTENTEINPALIEWTNTLNLPEYDKIKADDYMPAFQAAMIMHLVEINEIAGNTDEPTFENTIEAMELSGDAYYRVARIFGNLTSAHTNPNLQEIERTMAPLFPQHSAKISSNEKLFKRIDTLYQNRNNLELTDEQMRVLTETWKSFTRQGAALTPNAQNRLAEVNETLATLQVAFAQNVLADEAEYIRIIENEDIIKELPEDLQNAMKGAAQSRDLNGYGVTLSRSIIEPFLTYCDNRPLREELFKAWISRGEMIEGRDNRELVKQIIKLRQEKALLLGFDNFAKYRLDVAMAKTPQTAEKLMKQVWSAARSKAEIEAQELSELIAREGNNHDLEPWDWRYYAEKLRTEKFSYDEAEVKQYFKLDNMIEAAFHTANKLFGLTFKEHKNVKLFHEDVRVYEVFDKSDKMIATFISDYFARPSKRSGAWMSGLQSQHKLNGGEKPIIFNTLNFAKPPEGSPALLSMDDTRTLFHEFGHALHGMLSDVTYPSVSGTSVARDFVELPSQLYEHWLETPEILEKFALHYETGEPIPKALLDKLLAASTFNSGFDKVEFTASALVDMAVHQLSPEEIENFDPMAFQQKILEEIEMPKAITMRHATPHFAHAFASEGYAAGYYSYQWSEVLDADAFAAFEETGNVFDEAMAKKLYENIYSTGGSKDPEELYLAFRGKLPSPDAMLNKAGLV